MSTLLSIAGAFSFATTILVLFCFRAGSIADQRTEALLSREARS